MNFLDLIFKVKNDCLHFKIYQKNLNLYLYRSPISAQPKTHLWSFVYGSIYRYYWQNPNSTDYNFIVKIFFMYLYDRGHALYKLNQLFEKVLKLVRESHLSPPKGQKTKKSNNTIFCYLHLLYHPQNTPRSIIQNLYKSICLPVFEKETLDINQIIIVYHKSYSLENISKKNRLENMNTQSILLT